MDYKAMLCKPWSNFSGGTEADFVNFRCLKGLQVDSG